MECLTTETFQVIQEINFQCIHILLTLYWFQFASLHDMICMARKIGYSQFGLGLTELDSIFPDKSFIEKHLKNLIFFWTKLNKAFIISNQVGILADPS